MGLLYQLWHSGAGWSWCWWHMMCGTCCNSYVGSYMSTCTYTLCTPTHDRQTHKRTDSQCRNTKYGHAGIQRVPGSDSYTQWLVSRTVIGNALDYLYACMASSAWSGGEPLVSETSASKYLINVSGDKREMYLWRTNSYYSVSEWEGFQGLHYCQLAYLRISACRP